MDFLRSILVEHSALQGTAIISLVIALGIALGKLRFGGVSLGVTFVFFVGIFAGHLGLSIDPQMLSFAESFGLVLFVYELGLQVGPGFISSLQHGGMKLNGLGMCLIFLGTVTALLLGLGLNVSLPDISGIMCGATTNTPALAAAQQTIKQFGLSASGAALGCAVTYPLGVVGVIIAIIILRKLPLSRKADAMNTSGETSEKPCVAKYKILNPGLFGKSIYELSTISSTQFVISRMWSKGETFTPEGADIINENDEVLVVTTERYLPMLTILFGEKIEDEDYNSADFNWNKIEGPLMSKHIVITRPKLNGKKLGALKLRNKYHVNISRVLRSGVELLATPKLVLHFGDQLTAVGDAKSLEEVESFFGGKRSKTLSEPNLASIFVGIFVGLILGCVPVSFPGISMPVKLGLAGGPIIAGILMGAYGPRLRLVTYTTRSANRRMRGIGLSLYLACLGIDSGEHFVETLFRPEGFLWVGIGFIITIVPVIIMGVVAMRFSKLDFGSTCGMLCGAMANPMALNYVNDIVPNDNPSVSYATVYPLGMFMRVVIVQILLMVLL